MHIPELVKKTPSVQEQNFTMSLLFLIKGTTGQGLLSGNCLPPPHSLCSLGIYPREEEAVVPITQRC